MPLQFHPRPGAALALMAAGALLCACSSLPESIGSRPLIYKQGPGDSPETIEVKAGVVRKRGAGELSSEAELANARASVAAAANEPPPAWYTPRADNTRVAQATVATPTAIAAPMVAMPEALGRYTQASRYGDLLFLSGQIAVDPKSGAFDTSQTLEQQTQRALDNVRLILEANRLTMANVVSATVFVANINRLSDVDAVYHTYFKSTPPARTVVEVSKLPRGAQVQISVVAGR
jgi:2-iminobutanoate/2-iminopropanoate deaminase